MRKEDLKVGYVVELRNGVLMMVMIVSSEQLVLVSTGGWVPLDRYNVNMEHPNNGYDIVKVYGFTEMEAESLCTNIRRRKLLWERVEDNDNSLMILNSFADEVHKNAVSHGWWEEERSFAEIIALCHSELSEALEEYRKDADICYYYDNDGDISTDMTAYNGEKLEGIGVELADCVLRILDYCGKENIDIAEILKLKHEYNKTRAFKHGGKKI